MFMFIITCVFIASGIAMILLHPELMRSPKEALISGGVLVTAYVVAMIEATGHLHITVDDMLSALFSLLSPSRYFRR